MPAGDNYTGTWQEGQDRAKAKKATEGAEAAAGSKINQGLGGMIEKLEGGASATPTPAPGLSTGEPQRGDFPPGLGGQGEYNRALSSWKAKNAKPITGGKSLGGSR